MSKSIPGLIVMLALTIAIFLIAAAQDMPLNKSVPAKQGVKSLPDKKKNEETESLIERAGYAPPEIAADIILQLIESNTALDANRKRQLLEELFDLSYRVQYKLKLRESIDVSDSRIGNLGYAYSLNLDTLSIQCRTIKLMIPINKGRAVDLFRRIRIPDLDPLSCQDLMVPDISIYYDTLRDIVATALVDNESKRIESHNLIWNAISNISSPLQLGSVARMLVTLDLSSDDLSYFMSAFAARLKNLSSDPRSLAWSLRDAGTELRNLAMKCRARGVGYEGIIDGYRTFLVENMPKCLCHDFSDASKISEYVKKHTDNFNALLNDLFPDGNPRIFPLKAGQLNPKKIEKSPAVVDYTETPFGAKLLRGIRNLNFDQNGKDRSLAEKENTAWKHELKNYYHLFNSDIKDENMSEVDNFHNKCAIYGVLLQTVPRSNSMYEDILKDYLSFISQNRTQQESVIEWLWQARVVLLRTNLTKQSPDAVLKSMSDSGDEMLKLIAETRMFIAKIK